MPPASDRSDDFRIGFVSAPAGERGFVWRNDPGHTPRGIDLSATSGESGRVMARPREVESNHCLRMGSFGQAASLDLRNNSRRDKQAPATSKGTEYMVEVRVLGVLLNWIVPPPAVQSPAKQTKGARAWSSESPVRQTRLTNAITTRPRSISTRTREKICNAVS
jgi:hypothetical protein